MYKYKFKKKLLVMFTSNKRITHELSFLYMCEIQKIFFV